MKLIIPVHPFWWVTFALTFWGFAPRRPAPVAVVSYVTPDWED